jgi:Flp pilus assembly protein TadG
VALRPDPDQGRRGLFAAATGGAAAVEFALVVLPLIMLIFAILELALVFWLSALMDDAVNTAARKIKTGQVSASTEAAATAFKGVICDEVKLLASDCTTNLAVDVRTFATLNAIDSSPPMINGVVDPAAMTFVPGGPSDVVLVRAYYRWPIFTPGLTMAMGSTRLITATTTFRNEPYEP